MEHNNNKNGIGFCGALTIAFIVLKLCKVISWSWFWVLSPILIPTVLVFELVIVVVVAKIIKGAI